MALLSAVSTVVVCERMIHVTKVISFEAENQPSQPTQLLRSSWHPTLSCDPIIATFDEEIAWKMFNATRSGIHLRGFSSVVFVLANVLLVDRRTMFKSCIAHTWRIRRSWNWRQRMSSGFSFAKLFYVASKTLFVEKTNFWRGWFCFIENGGACFLALSSLLLQLHHYE